MTIEYKVYVGIPKHVYDKYENTDKFNSEIFDALQYGCEDDLNSYEYTSVFYEYDRAVQAEKDLEEIVEKYTKMYEESLTVNLTIPEIEKLLGYKINIIL